MWREKTTGAMYTDITCYAETFVRFGLCFRFMAWTPNKTRHLITSPSIIVYTVALCQATFQLCSKLLRQ